MRVGVDWEGLRGGDVYCKTVWSGFAPAIILLLQNGLEIDGPLSTNGYSDAFAVKMMEHDRVSPFSYLEYPAVPENSGGAKQSQG